MKTRKTDRIAQIAFHEAGHAAMACLYGHGFKDVIVHRAGTPRGSRDDNLGAIRGCSRPPSRFFEEAVSLPWSPHFMSCRARCRIEDEICALLAGLVAEAILIETTFVPVRTRSSKQWLRWGNSRKGLACSDLANCLILSEFVGNYCQDAYLDYLFQRTKGELREIWKETRAVADVLIAALQGGQGGGSYARLTKAEIIQIMKRVRG